MSLYSGLGGFSIHSVFIIDFIVPADLTLFHHYSDFIQTTIIQFVEVLHTILL